jgi:hypothetical protein
VPVTLIKDRLPDRYRIGDLGRVMRCAECDKKGNVIVDVGDEAPPLGGIVQLRFSGSDRRSTRSC